MQNISPSLQAKIKQQETTLKSTIQPKVDLSQKPDTVELSTKKTGKNKALKIVAICAGITAAVAGAFVLAKKGVFGEGLKKQANNLWSGITKIFKKAPAKVEGSNPAEKQGVVENVKKFISNGKEIEGVKLDKGKAILADGSMFTGTMETVTKSGKKVALEYENGFISKSTVNDKLLKTFKTPSNMDRAKGALIGQYDEAGNKVKNSYHFYHDDGKISKSMSQNTVLDSLGHEMGNYKVSEFSPSGKKIAEYETDSNFSLENGKVFNEDGSLKKEINKIENESSYKEKTYLPDGTSVEKIGDGYRFDGNLDTHIAGKELHRPKDIRFFDKEGNLDRRYYTHQFGGYASLTVNPNEISNEIKMEIPYSAELGKKGEQAPFSVKLIRDMEGNDGQCQSIGILDDAIVNMKMDTGTGYRGFTKDELLSSISELERGIQVAEDNGMLDVAIRDGCDVSYERFKKYIQQLKSYADKM